MAINRDSLLELAPLIRAAARYADGASKSERHFLDFVVDGQSLWEALAKRHDKVSVLCVEYAEKETANAISRLLLSEKAGINVQESAAVSKPLEEFTRQFTGNESAGVAPRASDERGEPSTSRAPSPTARSSAALVW